MTVAATGSGAGGRREDFSVGDTWSAVRVRPFANGEAPLG
jgi:hypothetical protein